MLLAPGQPIPHGRPYCYHLNGPVHMMTTRKRVGPLPTHSLAVRHSANHSSSDSSSEASSDFHSDASSDSSSRHPLSDHSSPDLPGTSAGPSRKRRRSLMTSIPALSPLSGALSPVRANLIPSPKRVKDFVSDEPHLEQDSDPEVQAEIDECFAYADALRDRGIDARVVVEAIDRDETETGVRGPVEVRVERITHPVMPEDLPEPAQEESVEVTYETLGDLVQRFHDHTEAIPVHRIQTIEGVQREQGHRIVGVESAVIALTERLAELERDNRRLRGTMSVESQREWARDVEAIMEDNGKWKWDGNGNGNGGSGKGSEERIYRKWESCVLWNLDGFMQMCSRVLTFQELLEVQATMISSGTEGVVGLTHWFEKMETVFNISNCPPKYQVKYATCTLQDSALTCVLSKMVPDEEDRVERFIGGLPDNIQGNVIAANPARLQDAIRIANQLMDKKVQDRSFVSTTFIVLCLSYTNHLETSYAVELAEMEEEFQNTNIVLREGEDKSEEKRLEDVPCTGEISRSLSEDCLGYRYSLDKCCISNRNLGPGAWQLCSTSTGISLAQRGKRELSVVYCDCSHYGVGRGFDIGPVAYRLRLPEELSSVHDTFHVSNLKKCLADANLHVPLDEIKVDKTLRFVEEPLEIMDREVKTLKRSKIPIVKVRWNSKRGPEFTWEREDHMKAKYPQLFENAIVETNG
ncbi:hypothetical protein Tco_0872153 [Tanacetum coccineum]